MITNSPARYEFYFILYHNFRFMSHTPHCLIQQDERACADLFTTEKTEKTDQTDPDQEIVYSRIKIQFYRIALPCKRVRRRQGK